MKVKKVCRMILCILLMMFLLGCGSKEKSGQWKDGYYTAIMEEYDFGWKEFVTICVMDHKIVSVEYNAKNASGFIKAWDIAYMRNMNPVTGTYPNRYTRYYAGELLERQDADQIDILTGATSSGKNFRRLTAAVLEHAEKGNTEIAVVSVENTEE